MKHGISISCVSKFSIFRKERSNWGVGRENLSLFLSLFFLLFRGKQHMNIFSNHTGRLTKFGWILTYLKISVEMAVTWLLPGAVQLLYYNESLVSSRNLLPVVRSTSRKTLPEIFNVQLSCFAEGHAFKTWAKFFLIYCTAGWELTDFFFGMMLN